jgi:hypothetical protein
MMQGALAQSTIEFNAAFVNPDYVSESKFLDDKAVLGVIVESIKKNRGVRVRYTGRDFQAGGPVWGNEKISSWLEMGVIYLLEVNNTRWIVPGLHVHQIRRQDGHRRSLAFEMGMREQITPKVKLEGGLSYLKGNTFEDWQLTIGAQLRLNPNVALVVRLRDYDESDFTIYETGLNLKF